MIFLDNFIIKEHHINGKVNRTKYFKCLCRCGVDRGFLTKSRYNSKPLCIKCSTNTEEHKKKLQLNHWSKKGISPTWTKRDPLTESRNRLRTNLRARLNKALKGNFRAGSAVKDLGCSIEELKAHLESKFQPGMSWNNYGKKGWHIDHIRPLSSYNLSDTKQVKEACHYTNLQPLWWQDNLSKGNR